MKKRILLLSLLFLHLVNSHSQTWEWVRKVSGGANDTGYSIDVDNEGNVFLAGRCKGLTTFEDETDPIGPLTIGDRDAFVSKYDKDGHLLWATLAGAIPDDYDLAQCVRADNAGGCYLTGFFNNESYFGDDTLTSNGFRDVFITRINADGNFIWAKGFGGPEEDNGYGATVDNDGNILICGRVRGVVNVEGTSIGTAGQYNAYVGKYDSDGNFIEIHGFQSPYRSSARQIEVDSDGNIFVCGGLNGNCVYEGMSLITDHSPSWDDAFLLKCNADFSPVWFQSGGGNYYDMGLDLAVSDNGVYLCGTYGGVALFDTIPITYNSTATGTAGTNAAKDMFIASYDKISGGIKWLIGAGNEGLDEAHGIDVSADENIYFSGFFKDSVSFGDTTLFAGGLNSTNIVTARLDTLGNIVWVRESGNTAENRGMEIQVDEFENVFVAGDFYQVMLFDDIAHTPVNRDAFGGKMTQHPAPSFALNDTSFCQGDTIVVSLNGLTSPLTYSYSAIDAYTYWTDSTHIYYIADAIPSMHLNGYIFATNNIYTDSILLDTVLNVYTTPIITLTEDTTVCELPLLLEIEAGYFSYDWNDGLATTNELEVLVSGTYHVIVTNTDGCATEDSIAVIISEGVIVDLPNDTAACGEITYTLADVYTSYDWNDGLDLDNEINITSTGIYYVVVTDEIGCTDTDTMEVTIYPFPTPTLPNDTTICEGSDFVIWTDDFYATYLWSTGESATDHISVTVTGDYELIVTDENECEGSNSILVSFVDCAGITEYIKRNEFVYIPSSNGIKNISDHSIANLVIASLDGKIVYEISQLNSGELIQLPKLPPATYLIYLIDNTNQSPLKIVTY